MTTKVKKPLDGGLNNVKVAATGKYLPAAVITNADFEKMIDTSDEWIHSRTGIKERRRVSGESTSDMAYLAALDAIEKTGYDKSKIDLLICATFTGEILSPSVANYTQAKLGLNEQDITCFDLNAACTGFIYAVNVATQMLNGGAYHSALVIGVETLSKYINYEDRNTCVLFGDGAGAVILENTAAAKPASFYTSARGDLDEIIIVNPLIHMEGRKVYQFAIKALEESVRKVLSAANLTIADIDMIIPHQANRKIIESAARALEMDIDKFFINIEKYGNTSSASIPIAFDEYVGTHPDSDGKRIVFVGFGGGFTWGAALLTL